jgi:hypothetical protein
LEAKPLRCLYEDATNKEKVVDLLKELLGERKARDILTERNNTQLLDYGGVLVVNESLSLEAPPDFTTTIQQITARLKDTKTGALILQKLKELRYELRFEFARKQFNFTPTTSDNLSPTLNVPWKVLADPEHISDGYIGVKKVGNGGRLEPAKCEPCAAFAHELIHAINARMNWIAYRKRGETEAKHLDWDNLEEQFTITGTVDSSEPAPFNECQVLWELNLPARWGHITSEPKHSPNVGSEEMDLYYGKGWENRFPA